MTSRVSVLTLTSRLSILVSPSLPQPFTLPSPGRPLVSFLSLRMYSLGTRPTKGTIPRAAVAGGGVLPTLSTLRGAAGAQASLFAVSRGRNGPHVRAVDSPSLYRAANSHCEKHRHRTAENRDHFYKPPPPQHRPVRVIWGAVWWRPVKRVSPLWWASGPLPAVIFALLR